MMPSYATPADSSLTRANAPGVRTIPGPRWNRRRGREYPLARRLLSSARGSMAVAPERSRPGRGSTDQIGAGMATTYALPAIADQVAARAPPRPLVLRTVAIAGF